MEQELAPLTSVLTDIEKRIAAGDPIPDFGTLTAWAAAEAERAGGSGARRAGRRPEAAQISIQMEGEMLSCHLTMPFHCEAKHLDSCLYKVGMRAW